MEMMDKPMAQDDQNGVVSNPDQHAFIMLGEKALFLVHMTMFHMEDHCFQMVLRASLDGDAHEKYLADRRAHPEETYFLGNTADDLFTVPSVQVGKCNQFMANIFRGIPYEKEYTEWPWKHSTPIVAQTMLKIDRVVYYRHFDFNLAYPQSLTYILFGAGDEAHMNHYQVKEPDFDQVVSLKRAPSWLPAEDLEAGVDINFPNMRSTPVYCANPIPEGTYQVQYAGRPRKWPIEVGQNWWCSTKVVNDKNPCSEDEAS